MEFSFLIKSLFELKIMSNLNSKEFLDEITSIQF